MEDGAARREFPDETAHDHVRERGWGRVTLVLVLFLMVPITPLRLLWPVENMLLLLVPAFAVCTVVGWMRGGRFGLERRDGALEQRWQKIQPHPHVFQQGSLAGVQIQTHAAILSQGRQIESHHHRVLARASQARVVVLALPHVFKPIGHVQPTGPGIAGAHLQPERARPLLL